MINSDTASAVIDLDALAENLIMLREQSAPAAAMFVIKADGYGHGMINCARLARSIGLEWLGVATPGEALALRASGDRGRVLCWLYGPGEELGALVAADVDVSVSTPEALAAAEAAGTSSRPARVHLKIDTGLSRNGVPPEEWERVCAAAAAAERRGNVAVVGVWSHLACADEPGHPSIDAQRDAFDRALAVATSAGLRPALRHLANSAAAITRPDCRYDLVRLGIAAYGVDPAPGVAALGGVRLLPVMTLRARLAAVRRIPAGTGVSYGHTWVAERPTTVGLVPLGYADGVPRHASSIAQVGAGGGRRAPVRGRVCMDQFVVDLGPEGGRLGEEVTLFGAPPAPTAAEWAAWCDTIGYEIVTRIGARVPRVYRGGDAHG